jgi:hypothetical protein
MGGREKERLVQGNGKLTKEKTKERQKTLRVS